MMGHHALVAWIEVVSMLSPVVGAEVNLDAARPQVSPVKEEQSILEIGTQPV